MSSHINNFCCVAIFIFFNYVYAKDIIMDSYKKTVRGEHSVNIGLLTHYEIDLSKKQGFGGGNIVADLLGYNLASVTISTTKATGTSGDIPIKQSNEIQGALFDLSTPKQVTLGENVNDGAFDITVSGQYLLLDLSGVTFGTQGKIDIKIVGKR